MASVSRAYVRRQANIIARLSRSASKTIAKQIKDVDDWDVIAGSVATICKAYTDMSASITAEYYAGIRTASRVKSKFVPVAESGFNADGAYSAVISILDSVQQGTATRSAEELIGHVANREIKNAADNCIRANVRKDPAKPRYAIVPDGDACAFCQMRASLGYTYADEDAVESHNNCTCTATPVFDGQSVEGYNPDEYKAHYDEAVDALKNGDISDELKERIANGDYDKTSQTLMVMRELQGIH